jgi:type IV secretion system protein VirB6
MADCLPANPLSPVAERLADYLDCRAGILGHDGFASVSGGWVAAALLAGCLTIYVALIGYRLLLGQSFGPRDALLATVRAGVVIAFVSSWPAYEATAYDIAAYGPAEIAGRLMPSMGLSPTTLSESAQRLDAAYASLHETSQDLPGPFARPAAGPDDQGSPQQQAAPAAPPSPRKADVGESPSGRMLVISAIGGPAAARMAAGFLLALGPLFILLGLFDATLGVFEGWVRALLAVIVAGAGSMLISALEVDFVESQVSQAGAISPGATSGIEGALMTTGLLFTSATLVVLLLAVMIGRGFRLPQRWMTRMVTAGQGAAAHLGESFVRTTPAPASEVVVSRAEQVADAVRRIGRREALELQFAGADRAVPMAGAGDGLRMTADRSDGRDGQGTTRRLSRPRTDSAKRRDSIQ